MSRNYELIRKIADTNELQREPRATRPRLSLSTPSIRRAPAPEELSDVDCDFRGILQTIIRRRVWIYISTATLLTMTVLLCIIMTPQYKAEAKLEILKHDAGGSVVNAATANGNSDPLDFNLTLQSQLAILKSDTLAWQVIGETKLADARDFNLDISVANNAAPNRRADKVLRKFKSNLKVDAISGTRLITVSYTHPDPKLAARIVNQLVSDFLDYTFKVRYEATTKATDWLGGQLVELKSQVEKAQQRAVQLQKESAILGEDEHHNIILTRLEQLNNEVTRAEADRVIKESILKLSRTGNPELIAGLLGTQDREAGPNAAALLNSLRQQEATANAEYADAAAKYGSSYPRLIEIKERLNALRSSIAAELRNVTEQAKSEYELAASRESAARKSFAEQKAIATRMNDQAIDYLLAKQEAESSRVLYENLLQKVKEAGILAGLRSSEIHVVDPAAIPARPTKPNVPLYLLSGTLAGIILGLGCVFVAETLDRTIRTVEEVETNTAVPVLGVIPEAPKLPSTGRKYLLLPTRAEAVTHERKPLLASLHNPPIAEAFRSACASLLLSRQEEPAKVLLITSGMAQEGKSFVSLNLAASLARSGRGVLLVDADLRGRTLSRALQQDCASGLSQVLSGEDDIKSAYHPVSESSGLLFLPAGAYKSSSFELLQSEHMAVAMQNWRQKFDHVVIDAPPVLPVADAVVLSPQADVVVVVVRFGVTDLQATMRTIRVLRDVRAPRVSVLMNAIDVHSPEYHNYFGSYSYYEYTDGATRGTRLQTPTSHPGRKKVGA